MDDANHCKQRTKVSAFFKLGAFAGKGALLGREIVHIVKEKTLAINEVKPLSGFLAAHALINKFLQYAVGNTATGSSGAKTKIGLVRELLARNIQTA